MRDFRKFETALGAVRMCIHALMRTEISIGTKDDDMSEKPYVVVRTYSAGVHVGYLESRDGKEVTLSNVRRLWYWKGAFTLNEVAQKGVGDGTKISTDVSKIILPEVIEVIFTSQVGAESLQRFPAHQP